MKHFVEGWRFVPPHDGLPQTEQIGCRQRLDGCFVVLMVASRSPSPDPYRSGRLPASARLRLCVSIGVENRLIQQSGSFRHWGRSLCRSMVVVLDRILGRGARVQQQSAGLQGQWGFSCSGNFSQNHLRQRTGGSRCQCYRVSCAASPPQHEVPHSGKGV